MVDIFYVLHIDTKKLWIGRLKMSKLTVTFEEVDFSYDSEKILESFNLEVMDGEFISIIGPSGSGKSTLFRLITGLEDTNQGTIYINGEPLNNRLGSVGYMPQQDLLMPWRTITENATLPLEIKGIARKEREQQVRELLKSFGLSGYEDRYPKDLSGGMRQRVSFLRAVLSGSNILLLDEPFSALDAITKLSMQEWLLNQWEMWKKTILFITHDVDEALFLSDRIFIIQEKPVHKIGQVSVPLKRPRELRDMNNSNVLKIKEELINQLRMKGKG